MFVARDPTDELVKCPFDDNHIILRSRIHYHLVKCRKRHPNCNKIVCPYNATEYLEPENFESHLRECKQKDVILREQHNLHTILETKSHGDLTATPFHMPLEKLDDSEIWDLDDDTSETTESGASSSATRPVPPDVVALREHLKKVYGNTGRNSLGGPKKPMGRGAMLKKFLGKE